MISRATTCLLFVLRDDRGQATMEYAMLATAFGVLMIAAMTFIQNQAGRTINTTQNGLSSNYSNP